MKKYFVTGLVILLPLALTIMVVVFAVNFLTDPFVGIFKAIFHYYNLFENGFLFLSAEQLQIFISQLLILVLLFFFTVSLGIIARWFFINYLLDLWDYALHRIPLVSAIYKTCQDVIKTLFTSKTSSFKQVVLVRFPNQESLSVGLVTRENFPGIPTAPDDQLVAVFVPTTPNPTSGFLMMFKPDDLIYLDMKVEEAFKYIISCGVIITPFKSLSRAEALARNAQREENNSDEA